ncbi:MauE/DoxX family redox-associated membrane protein [Gelidibacter japonicus]|uniref:MauE/DoxX family redox-associated membrane protein n=1 Tax=Gelidibacter japonicus TaxID=1962232 RepID=UPI0013CFEDA6|nr:MauE/DoxX family redox-associated membrane protein [Gelidibacter japonicus]
MSYRRKHTGQILITNSLALLFISLFAYAALNKPFSYSVFKDQLSQVHPIAQAATFLAWTIPLFELMVVVLLLWPSLRHWGFFSFLGLILLFTGYLIYTLYFSLYNPCSCRGVISGIDWRSHILFNLFFIGLAVLGILLEPSKSSEKQQ